MHSYSGTAAIVLIFLTKHKISDADLATLTISSTGVKTFAIVISMNEKRLTLLTRYNQEIPNNVRHHIFEFDENRAYADQVVSVLEASPAHPLSAAPAPRRPGVYVLFFSDAPVYVGKGKDLRSRLKDQSKTIPNRKAVRAQEITCRFLTIDTKWKVLRAEAALKDRYKPPWNAASTVKR